MKKRRVAFLTNFVSPYRVPVLRELTKVLDLIVVVNAHTEFDRRWETAVDDLNVRVTRTWTRKRTLRHTRPVAFNEELSQHIPVGLFADLRRLRPDLIISGELGPRSVIATIFGAMFSVPVVLWSYHSRASSAGVGRLRGWIWKALLRRCHAVVGMGTQAREVLRSLGVPEEKIFDAWNAPDVGGLNARLATDESKTHAEEIRSTVGDGRRIALVLGRLVPLKGIPELLTAWRDLPEEVRADWKLVFVGDGPYRSLVESSADLGVVAAGSVAPTEVPDWFSAADLHVFASLGDVWGLVVNEAQLCGTPTLCSVHAGCSEDLIADGVSGWLFDPGDSAGCREGLIRALTADDPEAIGRAGRESAERGTTEGFAQGFLSAIYHAAPTLRQVPPAPRSKEAA